MSDLSEFKITEKWPAADPSQIQLYSLPTPNGIKISMMLEETGLPYEAHLVSFGTNDQMTPEFLSLNPNNKIPAMIDPNGPDGKPIAIWESGAMLIYLAEKTGKFLPEGAARHEVIQWLMWQMGGLGPMFGQLGFFHKFAGKEIEDPRPKQRYVDEAKRLLTVLDKHLEGKDYVAAGAFTIADMAIAPWLKAFYGFYDAGDLVGGPNAFQNVKRYLLGISARPSFDKAANIPPRD